MEAYSRGDYWQKAICENICQCVPFSKALTKPPVLPCRMNSWHYRTCFVLSHGERLKNKIHAHVYLLCNYHFGEKRKGKHWLHNDCVDTPKTLRSIWKQQKKVFPLQCSEMHILRDLKMLSGRSRGGQTNPAQQAGAGTLWSQGQCSWVFLARRYIAPLSVLTPFALSFLFQPINDCECNRTTTQRQQQLASLK